MKTHLVPVKKGQWAILELEQNQFKKLAQGRGFWIVLKVVKDEQKEKQEEKRKAVKLLEQILH